MTPCDFTHDDVMIEADDSIALSARISSPKPRSRGTVIFVHGFAGNKHENGLFDVLSEKCAGSGLRSIQYDWRGLGSSEGEFKSYPIQGHVDDFQSVLKWARGTSEAQSQPMFAVGFSLGAAVVGLSLRRAKKKHSLNRISFLSPAVRPNISMWPRYNKEKNWKAIQRLGYFEKDGTKVRIGREVLESLSVTDLGEQAYSLDLPLLVCHGKEDARIKFEHSEEIYLTCKRHGARNLTFKGLKGASHSFKPSKSNWNKIAKMLINWFSKSPDQSPDTSSP
jgi:putative redox protein